MTEKEPSDNKRHSKVFSKSKKEGKSRKAEPGDQETRGEAVRQLLYCYTQVELPGTVQKKRTSDGQNAVADVFVMIAGHIVSTRGILRYSTPNPKRIRRVRRKPGCLATFPCCACHKWGEGSNGQNQPKTAGEAVRHWGSRLELAGNQCAEQKCTHIKMVRAFPRFRVDPSKFQSVTSKTSIS